MKNTEIKTTGAPPPQEHLRVALVAMSLADAEDIPPGPVVVLTGDIDAVKSAAKLFGERVSLVATTEGSDRG